MLLTPQDLPEEVGLRQLERKGTGAPERKKGNSAEDVHSTESGSRAFDGILPPKHELDKYRRTDGMLGRHAQSTSDFQAPDDSYVLSIVSPPGAVQSHQEDDPGIRSRYAAKLTHIPASSQHAGVSCMLFIDASAGDFPMPSEGGGSFSAPEQPSKSWAVHFDNGQTRRYTLQQMKDKFRLKDDIQPGMAVEHKERGCGTVRMYAHVMHVCITEFVRTHAHVTVRVCVRA